MQHNQRFLRVWLTIVTVITVYAGKAQLAAGISVGAHSPAASLSDKLPFVRTGISLGVRPDYTIGRFNINGEIGYQFLNTHNGMRALAQQYNYTPEKGYTVASRQGGILSFSAGAAFNLLPAGTTACGLPKPALLAGAQLGLLTVAGKINERIRNEAGGDTYVLQQTGSSSTLYYHTGIQMIVPVNSCFSLTGNAGYNKALNDFTVEQQRNGVTTTSQFSYTDLNFSIGVRMAFKSINEKGVKRAAAKSEMGATTEEPAALAAGQPIKGVTVKGGTNPTPPKRMNESEKSINEKGVKRAEAAKAIQETDTNGTTTDEPVALVAGQPIDGIVVKGGKNPGGNLLVLDNGRSISEKGVKRQESSIETNGKSIDQKGVKRQELVADPNGKSIDQKGVKRQELVADPNGKSISEKGLKYKVQENVNGGDPSRSVAMVYTSNFAVEDKTLLSYLGVEKLVIEKGEYAFDYSSNPGGSVRLKVQAEKVIHRDMAARAFVFDGVDAAGNSFSYTIEPVYVNGVIKELQVNYKSINEKGIK